MISSRGLRLISDPPMPYIQKVIQYRDQAYDEKTNPQGKILLCVAENKLCADMLLRQIVTGPFQRNADSIPTAILNYTSGQGLPSFREELAKFFQKYIFKTNLKPRIEHLVVGSGCIALLTSLSLLLFEDNDSVLIPVPYYPAFDHDFYNFANVHVYPIHCEETGTDENPFGYITEAALEKAYQDATKAGHPPRGVLLSNPNNPMGTIYRDEELRTLLEWKKSKPALHIIMDEIYALSVFSPFQSSPVKEGNEEDRFKSIMELTNGELGDFIHIVWSFSKDFGGSGLRVGVLYTQNEALLNAMFGTNDAMMASNLTQHAMEWALLRDEAFLHAYLRENSAKLYESYSFLQEFLPNELQVRIVNPTKGAIFLFADFRRFLKDRESFASELELFEQLAEVAGVVLTPGESCRCPYPGFFRICYAFVPLSTLKLAMQRMKDFLLKYEQQK